MAEGFAVDGNDLQAEGGGEGMHPVGEAVVEGVRVEALEDAVEGVVGRDTVGKFQERGEPVFFSLAILSHIIPGFGAGDDRTNGDNDDIEKFVSSCA
jgi:hypothetical protein